MRSINAQYNVFQVNWSLKSLQKEKPVLSQAQFSLHSYIDMIRFLSTPERTMRISICWQDALRSRFEERSLEPPAVIIFEVEAGQLRNSTS